MTNTIFQITEKVLTEAGKYSSNDGKLLRNLVLENAEKMDKELLSFLIKNKKILCRFTQTYLPSL